MTRSTPNSPRQTTNRRRQPQSALTAALAAAALSVTALPAHAAPLGEPDARQRAFAQRVVEASARDDAAALVAMMHFPLTWQDGCRTRVLRTAAQARQAVASMNLPSFRRWLAESAKRRGPFTTDGDGNSFGIGQGVIWASGTKKGGIGINYWQSRDRKAVVAAGELCRAVACQTRKHWLTVDLTRDGPVLRMGARGSATAALQIAGSEHGDGGSACSQSAYLFRDKALWRVVRDQACGYSPEQGAALHEGVPDPAAQQDDWLSIVMAYPGQACRAMPAHKRSGAGR